MVFYRSSRLNTTFNFYLLSFTFIYLLPRINIVFFIIIQTKRIVFFVFFGHDNPDGKDPFDRMKAANVRFMAAGENLALAQTVEIAHTNLMNSPGHRANILKPQFGRLGIGILDGGFYGLMISQEFRD